MPQVKGLKSLQACCLENVVQNIDMWRDRHQGINGDEAELNVSYRLRDTDSGPFGSLRIRKFLNCREVCVHVH